MATDQEKFEKQERAERLKMARKRANISGAKGVYDASEGAIDVNLYKGHESGRNGFSVSDGRRYAELFGVSLSWLYLGIGEIDEVAPAGINQQLRRAIVRLAEASPDLQERVANSIEFLLGLPTEQPSQGEFRDQPAPASHRRVSTPSE